MSRNILDDIANSMLNLEPADQVLWLINKALSKQIHALDIMEKGLRVGLEKIGEKYEAGEYFLSELLFGADTMNRAIKILEPELKQQSEESKGEIVLGTVQGDIHDIGKNIFKSLAVSAGFKVHDLNVDVDSEKFIKKLKETNADILAMSALLTTTLPEIENVISNLKRDGIRDQVRIIIGGNAVTQEFAKIVGADAAALDAVEGVKLCKELLKK